MRNWAQSITKKKPSRLQNGLPSVASFELFCLHEGKRECARRVNFLVTIFNIYHIILYIIKVRIKRRAYAK